MEKTVTPGRPTTLMQAHEELVRIRPSRRAPLTVWLEYYQRSVMVYEQLAKTDPSHNGEALYWAQRERHRVDDITAQIREQRPHP